MNERTDGWACIITIVIQGGNASNLNLRVFLFEFGWLVGWFGGLVHSASVFRRTEQHM